MMILEFKDLLPEGMDVLEEDYSIIEDVYMYYPAQMDKKEIADLYVRYGMPLIRDMHKRATVFKALEDELNHLLGLVNSLENSIKFLNLGHDPEELPDNIKKRFHIE